MAKPPNLPSHALRLASFVELEPYVRAFGAGREPAPCSAPQSGSQVAAGARKEPLPPGIVATKMFKSPRGITYLMHVTNVREPELELPQQPLTARAAPKQKWVDDGETFGPHHDRRAAKISISSAANEDFADLHRLRETLAADRDIAQAPGMGTGPEVGRTTPEDRNVTVTARLFASSKESDNDFHCILGTDDSPGRRFYINAEISGLPFPNEAAYSQLKSVRQDFKDYFGQDLPVQGYSIWPNGIPVRVSGSLFFDVFHYNRGNQAGTGPYKAPTYWEIHPITKIEFGPQ